MHNESEVVQLLLRRDSFSLNRFHYIAGFSDWLRLELIYQFGGLWLDASILMNDATLITEMHAEASQKRSEITGFHHNMFQTLPQFPIVESWAFMAPPRSTFVRQWRDEHMLALRLGPYYYQRAVLEANRADPQLLYTIAGTYLTIHVCAQVVLQTIRSSPWDEYAIFRDATKDGGPLSLQQNCGQMNFWCVGDALSDKQQRKKFSLIKLTAKHRLWLEASSSARRFLGQQPLTKIIFFSIIFLVVLVLTY